jgi:hypothetical protein
VSLLKLASMVSPLLVAVRGADDRCGPGCYGFVIEDGSREIIESRQNIPPSDRRILA